LAGAAFGFTGHAGAADCDDDAVDDDAVDEEDEDDLDDATDDVLDGGTSVVFGGEAAVVFGREGGVALGGDGGGNFGGTTGAFGAAGAGFGILKARRATAIGSFVLCKGAPSAAMLAKTMARRDRACVCIGTDYRVSIEENLL